MDAPGVARSGLKRMLRRRPEVITGWINAFMAFTTRFAPRPLLARIAWLAMRNK
jgi:short-subunit dehydrogenase